MRSKNIFLAAVCILIAVITFAQAPQSFKYQSIIRNAAGNPLATASVTVRATIHDGSASGTTVYQETHATTTNQFGLINLSIGSGTVVSGNFSTINWGAGSKWIEIEADFGAGYLSMGTSQLLSVPYALYAGNGGVNGMTGPTGPMGMTGSTGPQGMTGPSGAASNVAGPTGPTGPSGGPQGSTGATGPTGPAGVMGTTGAQGMSGGLGATGSTGTTGSTGPTGAIGTTGAIGASGATGVTGAKGATGTTGITGATGPAGTTGPIGATGVTGAMGATGNFGVVGTTGQTIYHNGTAWAATSNLYNSGTNVGIGTTSPLTSLHVAGSATGGIASQVSSATDAGGFFAIRSRGTVTAPAAVQTGDLLGVYTLQGFNGTDYGTGIPTGMFGTAMENFTPTKMGSELSFWTIPLGSVNAAERIRIGENGNVGIGTSTPGGKLHIAEDDLNEELVIGEELWTANDAANRIMLGNSNSSSFFRFGQGANDFGYIGWFYNAVPDNATMLIQTRHTAGFSGAIAMQSQGGNVGIGTNTPANPLHVSGTAGQLVQFENTADYSRLVLNGMAGTGADLIFQAGGISKYGIYTFNGTDDLGFYPNDGGTPSVMFMNNGNVGIGINPPTSKLHVYGTADPLQIMVQNTGLNFKTGYAIKTAGQEWFIGQRGVSSTGFSIVDVTNLNAVRIQVAPTTGYVGIGTTDPKSALHVVGLPVYANNAAAIAGGLTVGAFYRTGGDPDLVCVVH